MLSITLLLLALSILFFSYWRQQLAIKRWRKALAIDKHLANYQLLFADINGFVLSREARATQDAMEYTYGEIEFIPFIALLSLTKPNQNTVFYDLGSGVGKAVFACAMIFNTQKSCGIELFPLLHHAAVKQRLSLEQIPSYQGIANSIHFINADFLNTDFSDATLIFMNATAFFGDTWEAINQHLRQTKPGTIIITTSKKLSCAGFNLIKMTMVQMSWGPVKAYIQQRVT